MQAVLNANELKPFTRALSCLSKYGDEMIMHATANSLTLSSKNSALSAYCSIKYNSAFFHKYKLGRKGGLSRRASTSTSGSVQEITCQLLTKSLLSVLKHRNTEKSAEKCELTIIEGAQQPDDELRDNEDSLESRLLVRLHCRHGVVKTHRLLLNTVTDHYVPRLFEASLENKIVVRPRTVKEIIDHFPLAKGAKSDPQLIWRFDDGEVKVKSLEDGADTKGKIQLATELTVSADEFETFDIYSIPTTIGFHLREFNATIALADSLTIPIDIRFTEPAEPLYIHADADDCQLLFIISTFQVRGEEPPSDEVRSARAPSASASGNRVVSNSNAKKRGREEDAQGSELGEERPGTAMSGRSESRKSAKVVSRTVSEAALGSNANQHERARSRTTASAFTPTPVVRAQAATNGASRPNRPTLERTERSQRSPPPPPPLSQSQPLFLASQLSAAELATIESAGLGIENMDAEEFAAMLDGDFDADVEDVGVGVGEMGLVPESTSGSGRVDGQTSGRCDVTQAACHDESDTKTKTKKDSRPPTNSMCPSSETEEDEMELDYDPLGMGDREDNFRNFDDDNSSRRNDSFGEFGPTQAQGQEHGSGSASTSGSGSVPRTGGGTRGVSLLAEDSQKEYRALFED